MMQFPFWKTKHLPFGAPLESRDPRSDGPVHFVIIGHARSGTTILLSAFNTSSKIHLLSEPKSYLEEGQKNFRERFNATQSGYSLQSCKASYAPRLPDVPDDADSRAYFAGLSRQHPIYGEKIVLATPRYGHDIGRLQAWIERNRPHCLFVFRHPLSTLKSMPRQFPSIAPQENVYSYAMTICLYLDLARVLPNVTHVMHETITAETFKSLGRWLGADLGDAHRGYDEHDLPPRSRAVGEMATLTSAYEFLAEASRGGGRLSPVLSQIGGFMADGNTCEIAQIYYELRQVMDANRSFTLGL